MRRLVVVLATMGAVVGVVTGALATVLLAVYLLSMMLYTMSDAQSPGVLCGIPKQIFLLCPLLFLVRTSAIDRFKSWVASIHARAEKIKRQEEKRRCSRLLKHV